MTSWGVTRCSASSPVHPCLFAARARSTDYPAREAQVLPRLHYPSPKAPCNGIVAFLTKSHYSDLTRVDASPHWGRCRREGPGEPTPQRSSTARGPAAVVTVRGELRAWRPNAANAQEPRHRTASFLASRRGHDYSSGRSPSQARAHLARHRPPEPPLRSPRGRDLQPKYQVR